MGARRGGLAAVLFFVLVALPAGAEVVEANLEVAGRSDLGVTATYGDVTVVGTVAVVATGSCPAGTAAKVVELKDPAKPKVVATIDLPAGTTAADLDSVRVDRPEEVRDLLAVALAPCPGEPRAATVSYYDVTDPSAPARLGETAGARSVSLAHRGDDRVLAVRASSAGIVVDDLTDPARPRVVGEWRGQAAPDGPCADVQLYDGGQAAVAVLADGRVYDVDLAEPSIPTAGAPAESAGGDAGVLLLGNRTLGIVAEGHCDETPEPGLRVLTLQGAPGPEDEAVRYPDGEAPERLVTSGALAYVAWHGAGLRVVDFGEVRPRTVAQFVPAVPDVVSVALLSEHVVAVDSTSGLYVLERPDEGGGAATFWSQFLSLLPYLGFAALLAAALMVPRAMASRAAARSGARAPSPVPVPRRRA